MIFKHTFTCLHKELPITEFLPFETRIFGISKMVAESKWFIIASESQIPTSKARHCYLTYKACLQRQVTEKQTRIQIYSLPATPQGSTSISSLFIFCVELPSCLACTFCGYKAGALRHKSQDGKFQKKKKKPPQTLAICEKTGGCISICSRAPGHTVPVPLLHFTQSNHTPFPSQLLLMFSLCSKDAP